MHHAWNVKYVPAQASQVVVMCLRVRSWGFDLSINCISLHVLHSAVQPLSPLLQPSACPSLLCHVAFLSPTARLVLPAKITAKNLIYSISSALIHKENKISSIDWNTVKEPIWSCWDFSHMRCLNDKTWTDRCNSKMLCIPCLKTWFQYWLMWKGVKWSEALHPCLPSSSLSTQQRNSYSFTQQIKLI